jgi:hypothetical protein
MVQVLTYQAARVVARAPAKPVGLSEGICQHGTEGQGPRLNGKGAFMQDHEPS